jgi:hypothetical protein
VPNAAVFFAFNSGPNAGPAGPIVTDANGNATFTYTDNGGAGTDMISASLGSLVPGTFKYTPPAGTILPSGPQKLSAVFTPKDTTDFQTITVTATVEVVKPKH